MNTFKILGTCLSILTLTACASSASGLDAKSKFRCTEENGFSGCTSISQTFSQSSNSRNGTEERWGSVNYMRNVPYSGMPVRAPIRVMRVWIAPWEDKKGVLHDQSFLYFPLNESRWLIEHNREQIVDEYRPSIRLLGSDNQTTIVKATDEQLPDLGLTPQNNATGSKDPLLAPPSLIPAPTK